MQRSSFVYCLELYYIFQDHMPDISIQVSPAGYEHQGISNRNYINLQICMRRISMRWKDRHEMEGWAWDGRIGMRWKDWYEMEGSAWDGRIGMRWKDRHEMEGLAWDGRIGMRWKDWYEMKGSAWDGRIGMRWKDRLDLKIHSTKVLTDELWILELWI